MTDPSLAATTTAELPSGLLTTYASYLPSADAAGARNTPGRPATVVTVLPSVATRPRKADVSAPVWTSIRSPSSQVQYIGLPWRSTVASALPSAGAERSARLSASWVRNVIARPSGVQYR